MKKPNKPFLLLCKDDECHDVAFWFKTEKDLLYIAQNNTAITPYYAIEIKNYREIPLETR